MVREFDSNQDGELELDEFTRMMIQLQEHCATTAQGLTAGRSALEKQMMHSAATLLNRSRTGAVATGVTSALRAVVPAVLMIALLAAIHLQGSVKQIATAEATQITPWLLWVALGCAGLSTVVFVLILSQHGQKFESSPPEAKEASLLVIAICAMVPLYAFASALKLLLPGDEFALSRALIEGAKECYEAVVLHDFLELMYNFGGVRADKPIPAALFGRHVHFGPPVDWVITSTTMNSKLVHRLETWTLQYVLLQPVLVAVHLFAPHHPIISYTSLTLYLVSTTMSLSALIGFYHTFEKEIAGHSPLAKLMCIKLVVAMCFWQGIAVPILGDSSSTPDSWSSSTYQAELNDALICIEMGLVFSFAFCAAFWLPADNDSGKLNKPSTANKPSSAWRIGTGKWFGSVIVQKVCAVLSNAIKMIAHSMRGNSDEKP